MDAMLFVVFIFVIFSLISIRFMLWIVKGITKTMVSIADSIRSIKR